MSDDQFPYGITARIEQARENRRHQFFGPDGGFSLFDGQHKMPELTDEYKQAAKQTVLMLRHQFDQAAGQSDEEYEAQQKFIRRFKVLDMMFFIEALLESK